MFADKGFHTTISVHSKVAGCHRFVPPLLS